MARLGTRPHARGGATHTFVGAKTAHAAATSKKTRHKAATTKAATLSRVKPLVLAKTGSTTANASAPANGGRQVSAAKAQSTPPNNENHGIGFNTPQGRFSISPSGVELGGVQHPIASVGGVLSAVLVSLAALAAFAGVAGLVAAIRTLRQNRRSARRRARVASTTSLTREQLYSEAKRQNLPGRSNMTKAELEQALYPQQHVESAEAPRMA